jgi:hypothetical protein
VNLVRYEAARSALAAAHSVDEVKDIRDKAEAMAAYARQAKDQDLILWATEIKVRAERKAGELLRDAAQRGERATRADGVRLGANKHLSHASTSVPTLADIGVSKDQSQRWQALAAMPQTHFETAVATAKATAGQVTTAFMLREAAKHRPSRRLNGADKGRIEQLNQARSTSVLVGYARMCLKSLRERESFTEQELEVLAQLRTAIDRVCQPVCQS